MSRRRFVLRYRGDGPPPEADLERLRRLPGTTVLDASSRMVLVESAEDSLAGLVEAFPDWVVAPQQTIALPDTRPRISGPPE